MASGHVNRIKRPNTWLHRPMLQNVKKVLANTEPSTHGTFQTCPVSQMMSAFEGKADMPSRPSHFLLLTQNGHRDGPVVRPFSLAAPSQSAMLGHCTTVFFGGHMRRREFVTLICGAVAAWPLDARAQQAAMPVIGFLNLSTARPFMEAALRQGLSETGYVEGQTVRTEFLWADGHTDRLRAFAADLVRRRVNVIVAGGTPAALAARDASATVPVVFEMAGDPVKLGLVASLNRPGRNITGVTQLSSELVSKRLGLLHDLVPAAMMIGFLVNPADPRTESQMAEMQEAVLALGLQIRILNASTEAEIDTVVASLSELRLGALVVGTGDLFSRNSERLAALIAQQRTPAIYQYREYAAAGGLISYGASLTDSYRQVGVYTGRVLKGEKPADLPITRATRFELVINLKAARALGLSIPPGVLAIADEVIE
ncbi:ABC transporter substrate-binding protein [Bradyrhizobium sp.]|uniref:ABC transporter substrate-binding protein n=1 Tax=Bradyrhizobium sp. TaxID=376 RepID=UPI003C55A57C